MARTDGNGIAAVACTCDLLGSESRLKLLIELRKGEEIAVGDLAAACGLSLSATSQHLMKLKAGGLVEFRRTAQSMLHRAVAGNPIVEHVLGLLEA